MACHDSQEGQDAACAGWLAWQLAHGVPSITLRLALVQGRLDPKQIDTDGIELHESFEDFIMALEEQG